jgi:sugar phosphate isomerase/epimerase
MVVPNRIARPLGTMVAYGFPKGDVKVDLSIARRISATHLEILPDWRSQPDPTPLRTIVQDLGLSIHSGHAAWGGQAIKADRVDLGSTDDRTWQASIDDLKRCADWLREVGGRYLVIHPGGFSAPEDITARSEALTRGLIALADHVAGSDCVICVENMPTGVFPGSRMADLFELVTALGRLEVGLCLDTGHSNIVSSPVEETLAAGRLLQTTHVHDNDGRADSHDPPGLGVIDWPRWVESLDAVGYAGPIMLECIRYLRSNPESLTEEFLELLGRMCL